MGRTVYLPIHEWLIYMVNVGKNIPFPWILWVFNTCNIYPPSDSSVLVRNQSVLLLPPSRPGNWVPLQRDCFPGNWAWNVMWFFYFQPKISWECNVAMYVESVYDIFIYIYIMNDVYILYILPPFFRGGCWNFSSFFSPPPFADLDNCQRQWLFELRISHPRPWTKNPWRFFRQYICLFKKRRRAYIAYIYIYIPFGNHPFFQEFFFFAVSFVKNVCISPKKNLQDCFLSPTV